MEKDKVEKKSEKLGEAVGKATKDVTDKSKSAVDGIKKGFSKGKH